MRQLCECGECNEYVKEGNLFVWGHQNVGRKRSKEFCEKIRVARLGEKRSKEFCKAQSERMAGDKNPMKRPEVIMKFIGKNNSMYGRTGEDSPLYGRKRPDQSERMKGNQYALGTKHTKEWRDNQQEYMLNGQAAYMNSFIKNPSKPQVELYKLAKLIDPDAIINFPSLNYSIDIAIPDQMIAIEYDGSYWHQNKEVDIKRQKELELIGWKFLRYQDYVPMIKELKSDLQQLTNKPI